MDSEQLKSLIENRTYIILTNYGDDSLALIQWVLESDLLKNQRIEGKLKVVYIETGFAGEAWAARVAKGQAFAAGVGLEVVHLKSKITFQETALGRGEFPNSKFQWCSTVLKGLPLLDWLDEVDPGCRFIILSAKRRETLIAPYHDLPEWQEKSDHFNGRAVWHPIIEFTEAERNALLERGDFVPLGHRSLECDPCINSSVATLARLAKSDIKKIKILEETLDRPLFIPEDFQGATGIEAVVDYAKQHECHEVHEGHAGHERAEPKRHKYAEKDNKDWKGDIGCNGCKDNKDPKDNKVGKEVNEKDPRNPLDLNLFYRGCGNPFSCGM